MQASPWRGCQCSLVLTHRPDEIMIGYSNHLCFCNHTFYHNSNIIMAMLSSKLRNIQKKSVLKNVSAIFKPLDLEVESGHEKTRRLWSKVVVWLRLKEKGAPSVSQDD